MKLTIFLLLIIPILTTIKYNLAQYWPPTRIYINKLTNTLFDNDHFNIYNLEIYDNIKLTYRNTSKFNIQFRSLW